MNRYVFLSKSDAYDNFSLTDAKGIVTASNAMTVSINMKQANDIVWCASDRNLMIGTNNEEYAIKTNTQKPAPQTNHTHTNNKQTPSKFNCF